MNKLFIYYIIFTNYPIYIYIFYINKSEIFSLKEKKY